MNELKPGQQIGNYILDKPLGKGGLGEVWLAHHAKFTNKPAVAIKFVLVQHTDMFSWFEREAKILDKLRANSHIITAEDYGEQNGLPYLVMKYAPGGSLSDRINRPLPPAIVVNYVEQIADALDFAHSKGIIHRDLKPSNILFDSNDKLLLADFGIAHDEDTNLTRTGASMGTPGYMAPEQFLDAKHVSAPADIYSLGVMTFRMLAGQLPFQGRTPGEFEMNHRFTAIPLLNSFIQYIPPSVQPVLEKVLAKSPEERYQAAGEYAQAFKSALGSTAAMADLELTTPIAAPSQTFTPPPQMTLQQAASQGTPLAVSLNTAGTQGAVGQTDSTEQPTQATPATIARQKQKKVPGGLIAGGVGLVVLAVAAIAFFTLGSSGSKPTPTQVASTTATPANTQGNRAVTPVAGTPAATIATFNGPITKLDLRAATQGGSGHTNLITVGRFSPDGTKLVTASQDQSVRVWDTTSGKELAVLLEHNDTVTALAFSPDGKLIASGGSYADGFIRLWDGQSGKSLRNWKVGDTAVLNLIFSPDGQFIYTHLGDSTVRLYEAQTGVELKIFQLGEGVQTAAFSLDTTLVAVGYEDGSIKLWELKGEPNQTPVKLTGHPALVRSLDFSANGAVLASGSNDNTAKIWDITTSGGKISGKERKTLPEQQASILMVALNPDGRFLVTKDDFGKAKYWNIATSVFTDFKLADVSSFITFSPEGSVFASSKSEDRNIRITDIGTQGPAAKERVLIKGSVQAITSAAFSPDGDSVVTANEVNTLAVWDNNGKLLGSLPNAGSIVVFGVSKNIIFVANENVIREFNVDTGKEVKQLTEHKEAVRSLSASRDGKFMVSTDGKEVLIWDTTTEKVIDRQTFSANAARFSADGDTVAAYNGEEVKIFDFATRKLKETGGFKHEGNILSVGTDGKVMAVGTFDFSIKLFNKEGKELTRIRAHTNELTDFTYMPGRSLIASIARDNSLRLWEVTNPNAGNVFSEVREAKEILTQKDKVRNPTKVVFSPDGKFLAMGYQDGAVQLWELK